MLPFVLSILISAALVHAQTYQLRVYAGNDEVNGSLLRFDNTQAAFVPLASNSDNYPLIHIQHNPNNSGSLLVSESNDKAFVTQYVALLGSNGRYRMIANEHPKVFNPNVSLFYDEWIFLEHNGRMMLRYGYDLSLAGSWVVERRGEGWNLWWYEPREENIGDHWEYVLVDVEVERVDDDEVEDAGRAPVEEEADGESAEEEADGESKDEESDGESSDEESDGESSDDEADEESSDEESDGESSDDEADEELTEEEADEESTEEEADEESPEEEAGEESPEEEAHKDPTEEEAHKDSTEEEANRELTDEEAGRESTEKEANRGSTEEEADKDMIEEEADEEFMDEEADGVLMEKGTDRELTEEEAERGLRAASRCTGS